MICLSFSKICSSFFFGLSFFRNVKKKPAVRDPQPCRHVPPGVLNCAWTPLNTRDSNLFDIFIDKTHIDQWRIELVTRPDHLRRGGPFNRRGGGAPNGRGGGGGRGGKARGGDDSASGDAAQTNGGTVFYRIHVL